MATGGRHIDIRHGLAEHGPLDRGLAAAPQSVRLGVVGAAKDVENFRAWVDRCRAGIGAKKSHRTTLFVAFDGFGDGRPLCDFVVDNRLSDIISGGDVRRIGEAGGEEFAKAASERYRQGAVDLIEKANASVVACLLPNQFVRRIDIPAEPERGPRSKRRGRGRYRPVWHDTFKADALALARPVQVVRPAIYGGGVRRYTRDGRAVTWRRAGRTRTQLGRPSPLAACWDSHRTPLLSFLFSTPPQRQSYSRTPGIARRSRSGRKKQP